MADRYKPSVGYYRIKARADGRYEADPAGDFAKLTPVVGRGGRIHDVVAWRPAEPREWWLRMGNHPLLGAPSLAIAQFHHKSIRLHTTPASWLSGALNHHQQIVDGLFPPSPYIGCAVLSWTCDLTECFRDVGTVFFDSQQLRQRFQRMLRGWEPRLSILNEGDRRER